MCDSAHRPFLWMCDLRHAAVAICVLSCAHREGAGRRSLMVPYLTIAVGVALLITAYSGVPV
jgi:hypothetical protein